jgi:restriction endonuclease S subunit
MEATRKPVGELLDAVPRQSKIKRSAYQESGRYPIVDQSQADIAGYTDDESWLYQGELPVVIFGDHTRVLKFVDFPFCVGADGTQLLRPVAGNDIRYFYYALRNVDLTNYGYERHFKYLKEEEIPAPPLPVQRRIAGILSAYDELMENSQRRIRLLEAMARALYREWFVHFRFPGSRAEAGAKADGRETHPRVASPLGDIPQGWEVTTLRAVTTKIGSGATPRGGKDSYKTDGITLIRSLNIYDYRFEFADLAYIDEQQAAELDNVTVQEKDILLNITGASVARCALVPSYLLPARVNQHVTIVRADPAKASPFYVLDAINGDNRKAQLLALAQGGATREALTKDTVSNFEIVLPPRPLMQRYDTIARGIHKQREILLRQIQNLRRTRDLLLPRLLSGQVELACASANGATSNQPGATPQVTERKPRKG